jgi:multicomponent Na+:H+ antiporter subunit G
MTAIGLALMIIGSTFCFLAAIGLLRFPDLFTRLHASAKAGPMGAGLILLGAGVTSMEPWVIVRCALGLVFLIVVGPLSAHLLARAAMLSGSPSANNTSIKNIDNSPRP